MRLLIVDDSDVLRGRLVDILSEIEGIEIVGEEKSSKNVVQAIKNLKPDVVILDILMPGENGMSALEAIKRGKESPIAIMFTNYPYLQYRKRSMDLGADYFFYKAIEFENLVKLIKGFAKTENLTKRTKFEK